MDGIRTSEQGTGREVQPALLGVVIGPIPFVVMRLAGLVTVMTVMVMLLLLLLMMMRVVLLLLLLVRVMSMIDTGTTGTPSAAGEGHPP
jgi:hypothetical protein